MEYQIKDWAETFESPIVSRRPKKGMRYFCLPVGKRSAGRGELFAKGREGRDAYLVFILLCELTAERDIEKRGVIKGSLLSLSKNIDVPESDLQKALEILEEIGWLDPIATDCSKNDQIASKVVPRVEENRVEENRVEESREEESRGEEKRVKNVANAPKRERLSNDDLEWFEKFWDAYPKKVAKGHAKNAFAKAAVH